MDDVDDDAEGEDVLELVVEGEVVELRGEEVVVVVL